MEKWSLNEAKLSISWLWVSMNTTDPELLQQFHITLLALAFNMVLFREVIQHCASTDPPKKAQWVHNRTMYPLTMTTRLYLFCV